MKPNDIRTLHEKNLSQLQKDLDVKTKELSKLKLEHKVKPQKNARLFTILHDDRARILTVIREKTLTEGTKV